MKFSKLIFWNNNFVNFENIIIENLHLNCMKNLSVRFRSSLNQICLEWVDWGPDKVSENWDSDFHIFHDNYFENNNFEFFIGISIHLYISNHFTAYFSARASWWAFIHHFHPMDHGCKAVHKIQHFKILVDFQGFGYILRFLSAILVADWCLGADLPGLLIQTCPENPVGYGG